MEAGLLYRRRRNSEQVGADASAELEMELEAAGVA
jgi:hypothetical protein